MRDARECVRDAEPLSQIRPIARSESAGTVATSANHDGLLITGIIYLLVSITAIALIEVDELSEGATRVLRPRKRRNSFRPGEQ